MTDAQRAISPWVEILSEVAPRYAISPALLAGLVLTESSGNPWAIRPEPGFWRRYYKGIKALVEGTKSKADDRWLRYPDIASCSYGLCQIMLPVAWENGFRARFPTELLDPKINVELGAKILSNHTKRSRSITGGLLRYNGGGDPQYPQRVLDNAAEVADLFGPSTP
tara:strand:+ start:165 stop:665 length:501 start_codon:yes stop_codon:yes gene_type:complete